jgi:hypothetical protein
MVRGVGPSPVAQVIAEQHTGETVYVSAQFVSRVARADVVGYSDEVVL